MRFATWILDGTETAGILAADMKSVHSFTSVGLACRDMLDFIAGHTEADLNDLRAREGKDGTSIDRVRLTAPIPRPPHNVLCLGLNYRDHVEESFRAKNKEVKLRANTVYFSKFVSRALGAGEDIPSHADLTSQLDYEAELGVVIGRTAHKVREEDAFAHVFGLMCLNDVSARDLQSAHGQWFLGKSLDGFTVYGPWITSMDSFELPLRLSVRSRVNGEERQHGNTSAMICTIEQSIAELSAAMALSPGTIIASGTPGGVGMGFTPPRYMKPGDVCEIEIDGCGILRNTVK